MTEAPNLTRLLTTGHVAHSNFYADDHAVELYAAITPDNDHTLIIKGEGRVKIGFVDFDELPRLIAACLGFAPDEAWEAYGDAEDLDAEDLD